MRTAMTSDFLSGSPLISLWQADREHQKIPSPSPSLPLPSMGLASPLTLLVEAKWKVAKCDHVTLGHCSHHKCKLTTKCCFSIVLTSNRLHMQKAKSYRKTRHDIVCDLIFKPRHSHSTCREKYQARQY